ncbi:unnamed protein product [Pylaiella littoralis]
MDGERDQVFAGSFVSSPVWFLPPSWLSSFCSEYVHGVTPPVRGMYLRDCFWQVHTYHTGRGGRCRRECNDKYSPSCTQGRENSSSLLVRSCSLALVSLVLFGIFSVFCGSLLDVK